MEEKNVYVENIKTPVSVKDKTTAKSENEARFDELYLRKKVKFTGTIKEIRTNILKSGSSSSVDEIIFKEGWELNFPTGFCEKLSQLNKGDTLEVESIIQYCSLNTISVFDYGYRGVYGQQTILNRTSIKFNGEEICKIVE